MKIPAKVSASFKNEKCHWHGIKYPPVLPYAASFDQPFAKTLLPPGASIFGRGDLVAPGAATCHRTSGFPAAGVTMAELGPA